MFNFVRAEKLYLSEVRDESFNQHYVESAPRLFNYVESVL